MSTNHGICTCSSFYWHRKHSWSCTLTYLIQISYCQLLPCEPKAKACYLAFLWTYDLWGCQFVLNITHVIVVCSYGLDCIWFLGYILISFHINYLTIPFDFCFWVYCLCYPPLSTTCLNYEIVSLLVGYYSDQRWEHDGNWAVVLSPWRGWEKRWWKLAIKRYKGAVLQFPSWWGPSRICDAQVCGAFCSHTLEASRS